LADCSRYKAAKKNDREGENWWISRVVRAMTKRSISDAKRIVGLLDSQRNNENYIVAPTTKDTM